MTSVLFLVPKHPYEFHGGDTAVTRLLIASAMELCSVRALALWSGPTSISYPIPVDVVAKPAVCLPRLALSSLSSGRSIVHSRYRVGSLRDRIAHLTDDRVVAEHAYMTEAFYASGRQDASERLYVNLHVREADVMRTRPDVPAIVRGMEARRLHRDEMRCVVPARACAVFDENERLALTAAADRHVVRLDLVLPPAARSDLQEGLALFVGDRRWSPNAVAHRHLVRLWPAIADRVPGARLLIVGRPADQESRLERADVVYAGFVEDIEAVWRRASLLLAPVTTGGGVRVKVLEAAAHGVPIVGYPPAMGSIPAYLPLTAAPGPEEFVEAAVSLLADRRALSAAGGSLHETVTALWRQGFVQRQVASWLEVG
jgi:glycosyltransferase involved in cell wall biosynthesis